MCAGDINVVIGIVSTAAYEGNLRLVNGSDYTEGRLEIFHDDQWGSICDNTWFGDDASVACRQMGLGNVKYAYQDYGPGQGPVHLDDVDCRGTEMYITTCQKGDWGVNNCGHDSDVGMSCFLFEGKSMPIGLFLNFGWNLKTVTFV
ncbi:scavenger receptor class A member 5-like [Strongylocentrotus purpuratus]|uniref:SRCR domain-containing protein n=1 Tax=Strongylocentrotus purpuratus TaxID=7668 RepID=A0A7M7HJF1_STRPU|nr:scavenger receptor class A member 5-like [Strongylocentrotus purpuratus]|eukprot:XP_011673150.1 PREDICTED: scavenger receptor class A member 5-like [Strongylocentrotus purpuratus]